MPWPNYDRIFRVSSSQAEGCRRKFSILTESFILDSKKTVRGINYTKVNWDREKKSFVKSNIKAKINADLILLSMGFLYPEPSLIKSFKIKTNQKGNIATGADKYQTNIKNVFTAGDSRRGQSLVVWAISEGRECAVQVDEFLTGKKSLLKSKFY